MALKLLQRLPKQVGQIVIHRYACTNSGLLFRCQSDLHLCVACLCTLSPNCIQNHGCRKRQLDGTRRGLTTIVREPSFAGSSSVGLHKDSFSRFCLIQMHHATPAEEQTFYTRLNKCTSSRQVFRFLRSVEVMTDSMAAASLHRVAELEQGVNCLKDPSVLEEHTIRVLCKQLEEDSGRLTDGGLISALLACTRLYLDPWSTLMVRLVSESQERLDRGYLKVGHLCDLGQAMLALEGPGSVMLEQVMSQIQKQEPAQWSLADLRAMYKLLQSGAGFDGKYCDLLNAMHTHAVTVTSHMNPATVSELLGVLTSLNQTQAMPLVISLCKRAVRHVPHFSDEELTLVLGALMHFGHSDHYFVDAMEKYVPTMAFISHPETVTKVMQFFGRRNILSPVVFDAVAESFVYRADEYTPSQVARQIMPFGKLGYLPPNAANVFRKVETILHTRFSHFQPRTLLNVLHSCILVERFPVNFVSKVFSSYFLQQLQEQGTGIDRYVLAQLTQLYMTMKLECPFYEGPQLLPQYRVKSFLMPGHSLETPVDVHLYNSVKTGLVDLLGARSYFGSKVLTPYCYTLDVEIKLDEEGFVLPASHNDEVFKRIALCIDGQKRYTSNKRQLLGKEATKQRHLRLLGYDIIQIPFYEFDKLRNKTSVVEYLHQKIFPHSYRLSW
ncbi:FAST kinase domain-containing protein 3, mitochondrial [Periophthalmus magnuspinnatus]|uniref:FAST kinase domain-containing protein 3, mitochondrial n=1 Tax=Periophthalmus magnuspinnatus TaxID=409849 RepID=UPI00145ADB1E|nr:FAST kinase domain-containing protein 3, mitochondrial [Periophthalmus magnuspinnatus]XP_055085954.1 FAST kinase domain-containing protein 3, mitochondrial [Periophthalmus magnuspinnatus]XP_055085955.1 FAST kinase domain-containing protein 3, mitochondrial [Periophthalmus magnuspinnatus]XP_055085956.1 FAST kinase domain-containing protein 3, mitochondrial [Periophthalmus magnuspinnatus]